MCLITLLESWGSTMGKTSNREMPKKNAQGILTELQHAPTRCWELPQNFRLPFFFPVWHAVCGNELHHPEGPQSWDERIYLKTNIACSSSKLRGCKGMPSSEDCWDTLRVPAQGGCLCPVTPQQWATSPGLRVVVKEKKEQGESLDFPLV